MSIMSISHMSIYLNMWGMREGKGAREEYIEMGIESTKKGPETTCNDKDEEAIHNVNLDIHIPNESFFHYGLVKGEKLLVINGLVAKAD